MHGGNQTLSGIELSVSLSVFLFLTKVEYNPPIQSVRSQLLTSWARWLAGSVWVQPSTSTQSATSSRPELRHIDRMNIQEEPTTGEQIAASPLASTHTLHANDISRSPSVPATLLPPPPTMTTMAELTYVNSASSPSSYHPGFPRFDIFESSERAPTPPSPRQEPTFPQKNFFDLKDLQLGMARKIYLKVFFSGLIMVVLVIFMVFPIYWGSLWKVPAKPLEAWVVVSFSPQSAVASNLQRS